MGGGVPPQNARARRRVAERQGDVVVVLGAGGVASVGTALAGKKSVFFARSLILRLGARTFFCFDRAFSIETLGVVEVLVPLEGHALGRPRRARGPRREPRAQRPQRRVEGVVREGRGGGRIRKGGVSARRLFVDDSPRQAPRLALRDAEARDGKSQAHRA